VRQTSLHGNCGYREVAKAINSTVGANPNVAFTILKHILDVIAGKSTSLSVLIRLSLVDESRASLQQSGTGVGAET
jgi:hypothetical protein